VGSVPAGVEVRAHSSVDEQLFSAVPLGATSSTPKRLLVVIPALNEVNTVGAVVRAIPRKIPGISEIGVVVIDDSSTDGTGLAAAENGAQVVRHESPRGVGTVFGRALDLVVETGADVMVYMDGDGQFDPADIPRLIAPILAGTADLVVGRRYGPGAPPRRLDPNPQPLCKRLGNLGMACLLSVLTWRRIYDAACGFRAYSAETAMKINPRGRFTYTQEVLLEACFKGLRLEQVPIRVRGQRAFGQSRVARSLVRYGYNAIFIIARTFRDYKPLRFFGWAGGALSTLGLAVGGFFIQHYLRTGKFHPHTWAGFVGAFFLMVGMLMIISGLLADMLDRIRLHQEEILYAVRAATHAERRRQPWAMPGRPIK